MLSFPIIRASSKYFPIEMLITKLSNFHSTARSANDVTSIHFFPNHRIMSVCDWCQRACWILSISTILDKTVGKVSTFEVFVACLPFPLLQCCAKQTGFSGKLLSYLPTLNRGGGGLCKRK